MRLEPIWKRSNPPYTCHSHTSTTIFIASSRLRQMRFGISLLLLVASPGEALRLLEGEATEIQSMAKSSKGKETKKAPPSPSFRLDEAATKSKLEAHAVTVGLDTGMSSIDDVDNCARATLAHPPSQSLQHEWACEAIQISICKRTVAEHGALHAKRCASQRSWRDLV